jgi:hypothetical protein
VLQVHISRQARQVSTRGVTPSRRHVVNLSPLRFIGTIDHPTLCAARPSVAPLIFDVI